jgi:3'-5' exoribonuclease
MKMKIIDLPGASVGERLEGNLLVCEVDQRGSGHQPFVVLTLGNATGRIQSAPFWSEDLPQLADVRRGKVVRILGDVTSYRERRQLRVSTIRPLPEDGVNWKEMLPSVGDTSPYWEALDGWRSQIAGPRLRSTVAVFYDDSDFRHRYGDCPASINGHHALLGGLLRHTWEVVSTARSLCRLVPADPDLVLAGALLHDIGKVEAYAWQRGFEHTPRGRLHGHVVLGSLMLEQRVGRGGEATCIPEELDLLHHLILSHHGKLEFGAPVEPMTLEAELLHHADNASARAESMARAIGAVDNFLGDDPVSCRTIWQLDHRRVFRGKSTWGL